MVADPNLTLAYMKQEPKYRLPPESNLAMETPTLILGGLCCSSLKYELVPVEAQKTIYIAESPYISL